MNKTIFVTGIIMGVLAVALGAIGAHTLEKLVDADDIQTFETGVRYQIYHALLLLILGSTGLLPSQKKKLPFYLIVVGVVLFSFSIYLLTVNDLTQFDFKSIGFVTPIGGMLLILGWTIVGYRVWISADS